MTEDQISRFWAKVDRSGGNTACWPWMGGRNDDGYGIYHNSQTNRQMGAHRMAYMLSKGAIENG